MKYNKLEDKAIQILRDNISDDHLRPRWSKIVHLMNSHRAALHGPSHAYTISMVRNRHQRITKSDRMPKRNICGTCRQLQRGHTCIGIKGEYADDGEDSDDVVYNLLGIDNPMKSEIDKDMLDLLTPSNDACDQPMTSDTLDDHELPALFELFRSYVDSPEPIEKYRVLWDSMGCDS